MKTVLALALFLSCLNCLGAAKAGSASSTIYKDDTFGITNLTVIVRVRCYTDPGIAAYRVPVSYADANYDNGLIFFWDGNSTNTYRRSNFSGAGTAHYNEYPGFVSNRWYHVAMTVSNVVSSTGYSTLYVDGVFRSQIKLTAAATGTAKRIDFPGSRFSLSMVNGEICGIAVFDRVLSAAEVKACYLGNPIMVAPRNLLNRYWMPLHAQKALYSPQKITYTSSGMTYTFANPPLNGPQQ